MSYGNGIRKEQALMGNQLWANTWASNYGHNREEAKLGLLTPIAALRKREEHAPLEPPEPHNDVASRGPPGSQASAAWPRIRSESMMAVSTLKSDTSLLKRSTAQNANPRLPEEARQCLRTGRAFYRKYLQPELLCLL